MQNRKRDKKRKQGGKSMVRRGEGDHSLLAELVNTLRKEIEQRLEDRIDKLEKTVREDMDSPALPSQNRCSGTGISGILGGRRG